VKTLNWWQSPPIWQAQRENKPHWKTLEEEPIPS
jgi:hypothetical protein